MANVTGVLKSRVLSPLKHKVLVPAGEVVGRVVLERKVQNTPVDPAIHYPCYKSFDDLINVERLKSLDTYVTSKIEEHKKERDDIFYSGFLTLKANSPKRAGSRIINLSRRKTARGGYLDLDKADLWAISDEANEFPLLMDFIATLPFKTTARMMIMYDSGGHVVTPHRDHSVTDLCHEFLWFRTNLNKPFYMLNPKNGEKRYVQSYSAWFDSVNQFHGADAYDGMSFSIRVDGTFTDEFRKRIPVPKCNPASAPALWACNS
ncbi:MAG: hypothetical protein ABSC65_04275 [Acidobacteriaceae bacterium]|jgi:hypothetical protein